MVGGSQNYLKGAPKKHTEITTLIQGTELAVDLLQENDAHINFGVPNIDIPQTNEAVVDNTKVSFTEKQQAIPFETSRTELTLKID